MLEITIPAGYNLVADPEVKLSNYGLRGNYLFFTGDTIELSDKICSRIVTDKAGNSVKDKDGNAILSYAIMASVNGGTPRPIPIGTFRRFPRDPESFLSKSNLMRSLFTGSDADRYALLKGKKLRVTSVEAGEAIDWDKSDADTKNFVFKQAKFPVFDIVAS